MSSIARHVSTALGAVSALTLLSPVYAAQPAAAEGGLEEVIVTAQYREENLQDTPLAITAISGEQLEARGLNNVVDLGLAIPNAQMRQSPGQWGPNSTIGLRGVGQMEFIYTAEPGVGIYVDDVYHGTLTGSNLDLLDLERVEVLRGPQGTLFGKNSLGGAVRMISKAPKGDNAGSFEATIGSSERHDFKGSYDMSLIEDKLFMRVAGASKSIAGYQDRLDFTCQMIANGTPALAGTLPQLVISNATNAGDCKLGENGGSESHAIRVMFRYLATDRLEFNLAADYSKVTADPGAEMLLSHYDPVVRFGSEGFLAATTFVPRFGIDHTIDNRFLSTRDYNYATYSDPVLGRRWPTDQITEAWSTSGKIDYNITDTVHAKFIVAYRTYDATWASDGDLTPLDAATATTLNLQTHDQTTLELQVSGKALGDRVEWTTGAYYYDDSSELGGAVTLPAFGGITFAQNDSFTTESESVFAHGVFHISDKLSANLGARFTDESKVYDFDHTGFLSLPTPLEYGKSHFDWKASLDYKFTEGTTGYALVSTGFRSEGANPRPFNGTQLTKFSGEEILAYELGLKTDLFDRRLRVNAAVFLNDYDPRLVNAGGIQCNNQVYRGGATCPVGVPAQPGDGLPWFAQEAASGKAKGAELELTWTPIDFLAINGSFGYYDYKSDAGLLPNGEPDVGYIAPGTLLEAKYTGSLGAQYTYTLPSGGRVVPRIDSFYQGKRSNGDSSRVQLPQNFVPGYTLVNARLSYLTADASWMIGVEASNLLDREYWSQLSAPIVNTPGPTFGTTTFGQKGSPGRGREYALTVTRHFN